MARRTEFLTFRWLMPHHFIGIFGTVAFMTIVASYVVAVSLDHVYALFPYISDTGTRVPESCIFSLLLNCLSVFAGISFYVRYRHVAEFAVIENRAFTTVNDVSLFLAFVATFGMMVVASFQETSVLTVHVIGAILTFGGGLVYCWLQCYISFNCLRLQTVSKCCCYFRLVIACVASVTFVTTFVGASVAGMQRGSKMSLTDNFHWDDSQKGYGWHLVSTFSEWIMAISFFCFILTFFNDFKQIRLTVGADRCSHHHHEGAPLHEPVLS